MSRNRNIRNFDAFSNVNKSENAMFGQNVLSPIYGFGDCFSERKDFVNKTFQADSIGSNGSDILNFISGDSRDNSYSSSSISWAEDFEEDASRQIENELTKIENILLGIEKVPNNYDKEEFKLWMNTFPPNRLLGKQEKYRRRQKSSIQESFQNYLNIESICDKSSTSEMLHNESNGVVFAEQKDSTLKRRKNRSIVVEKPHHEIELFPASLDAHFENVLKITRAPMIKSPIRSVETRRHSNVIVKSQLSASKWLRSDTPEFSSMPYLIVEQVSPRPTKDYSASRKKVQLKSAMKEKTPLNNRHRVLKHSPHSTCVTLPPIDKAPIFNQYRSISATPRQDVKRSVLSVNSLLGRLKSTELGNFVDEDDRNILITQLKLDLHKM